MNVNAVGPSDSTDIRKAAIEAAMINKEPTAQDRAIEAQRNVCNYINGKRSEIVSEDVITSETLASLFSQLKCQADVIFRDAMARQICVGAAGIGDFGEMCGWIDDTKKRIAELEKSLPSAGTYRAVMDERAKLAQRVAELESERGKCQTCGAPISRDCSKCSAHWESS